MRYAIDFNRLTNRLIPHYLGGRKIVLFLQACIQPLQQINNNFREWAREMHIAANMTSQSKRLAWYLTRKFNKEFADSNEKIVITTVEATGTPFYYSTIFNSGNSSVDESNRTTKNASIFFKDNEQRIADSSILVYQCEINKGYDYSFIVRCPELKSNVDKKDFELRLKREIDVYVTANKTYTIIFND